MKRTTRVAPPSQTARAVDRAVAQQGSHDSQIHLDPAIKRPCGSTPGVVTADGCGALANERCASERYPSGRPRYFFSGFHPGR